MFSIITIASSTTKPVAMVSAINVRLLIENPARYMKPKVPTRETGTATLGMAVARALRRKKKITITTRNTESNSSICTSFTEARMVAVRSVRIFMSIDAGSVACNCGIKAFTLSTTSITLAPGWRWMLTMMAGDSLAHAARRTFSASSTTSATSESPMGRPLR